MDKQVNLKGTLAAPVRHPAIPQKAQWLSGEGAGSWFFICPKGPLFQITRYSPNGKTECSGEFMLTEKLKSKDTFNPTQDFELCYLSHCAEVNVTQNKVAYQLVLMV